MYKYKCIKICISIQYICIYKGIYEDICKGMNKYPIYVYICIYTSIGIYSFICICMYIRVYSIVYIIVYI